MQVQQVFRQRESQVLDLKSDCAGSALQGVKMERAKMISQGAMGQSANDKITKHPPNGCGAIELSQICLVDTSTSK